MLDIFGPAGPFMHLDQIFLYTVIESEMAPEISLSVAIVLSWLTFHRSIKITNQWPLLSLFCRCQ